MSQRHIRFPFEDLSDVTISLSGTNTIFHCHRYLLYSHSPILRQCPGPHIEIPSSLELTSDDVYHWLSFMYSPTIYKYPPFIPKNVSSELRNSSLIGLPLVNRHDVCEALDQHRKVCLPVFTLSVHFECKLLLTQMERVFLCLINLEDYDAAWFYLRFAERAQMKKLEERCMSVIIKDKEMKTRSGYQSREATFSSATLRKVSSMVLASSGATLTTRAVGPSRSSSP